MFTGRVEELIYLGDHIRTRVNAIRTRVNACRRDDFMVKFPNSSGTAPLKIGEDVKVGSAMEDCRALDA